MEKKKKRKRKKRKSVLWLFVFLFIGGFFLREQYTMYKLVHVKAVYQERLGNVKIQNQQLINQLAQSKRSDYVENQARTKLGLVKQDEILFIDKNKKK